MNSDVMPLLLVVSILALVVQYFIIKHAVAHGIRLALGFLVGRASTVQARNMRDNFAALVNSVASDWTEPRA